MKGAGSENSPERPVLTVPQVYALADAIAPRYRALILLATFASLRWAELAALTSQDIDLDACTVRVTRQINYLRGGGHSFGPPKSRAGRRVVSFPELIAGDLRKHRSPLCHLTSASVWEVVVYSALHLSRLRRACRISFTDWFTGVRGSPRAGAGKILPRPRRTVGVKKRGDRSHTRGARGREPPRGPFSKCSPPWCSSPLGYEPFVPRIAG